MSKFTDQLIKKAKKKSHINLMQSYQETFMVFTSNKSCSCMSNFTVHHCFLWHQVFSALSVIRKKKSIQPNIIHGFYIGTHMYIYVKYAVANNTKKTTNKGRIQANTCNFSNLQIEKNSNNQCSFKIN